MRSSSPRHGLAQLLAGLLAASIYSSGMSNSVCVVPSQWRAFMRTMSMTPSKSSPVPTAA